MMVGLVLVERRGRQRPIDPRRQVEIRTLLNSLPNAAMILDRMGVIVDANDAADRIAGLSWKKLVGRKITEYISQLNTEPLLDAETNQNPILQRALAGEVVREERRRIRNLITGEVVDLLISANPICDENGETRGVLIVARDITELIRLQQRLADIEKHQAIGHVAAGIAHDFNNTLQTISEVVAVLQMSPNRPVEEQKIFLDMIQNAVKRGGEVISRIRDYLRSGTGQLDNVDVMAVTEEAIELTRPMWQSRPVELKRELEYPGFVRANKADLLRMFTNLIINSLQAMPAGGTLTVGCARESGVVHVWIRDTGSGIAPEIRNRIFNPYFTTKAEGTGLGLSGAQKIMLELGGNISFTSDFGKGTQFDLRFPKDEEMEKKTPA